MNWIVAVLAVVAAVDLPQRAHVLRRVPDRQRAVVAAGLVAAGAVIAAVASPVLDALDVSGPTLEIGAGIILGLWSIVAMLRWENCLPPPAVAFGIFPLLFPIVLTPPVGVTAMTVAARNGWWLPVLALAVAATPVAVRAAAGPIARRSLRALSGAAGVVVAVAMIVDGTYAV